jgi:structural maintenance of chromosome 4
MFELAARLVGVYKVNHMTKCVTIENKDYITRPAEQQRQQQQQPLKLQPSMQSVRS